VQNLASIAETDLQSSFANTGYQSWLAGSHYSSFLFDTWCALEGDNSAFSATQILGLIKQYMSLIGPDNQIPAAIQADGTTAVYYSGWDKAHLRPIAEGSLTMPLVELLYYQKSGSIAQFNTDASTLSAALAGIPVNRTTYLVTITPGSEWIPWGFQEEARFTGDVASASIMLYRAYNAMATLYSAAGNSSAAAAALASANLIASNISELWDSTNGMFYGASIQNRQIDILASAMAVYSGIASSSQQTAISSWLVSNYSAITHLGFVRQSKGDWSTYGTLITGGPPYGSVYGPGQYQNGYWAVGDRWIMQAMAQKSNSSAVQLVTDYLTNPNPLIEWMDVGNNSPGDACSVNLESPMGVSDFITAYPSLFPTS
jgi:hypothetical protein